MNKKISILYFGIYNPEYSRNRVIIKGLKENGVSIMECRESANSRFKYFKLLIRYLKMRPQYDVMIVGFPGQEAMFLARFLTFRPIIFDAFTSHYGGYILDRGYYSKTGLRAIYYRFLDRWSCRLADRILLDTQAHINFFVKEYGLPSKKFIRIFVGSDTEVFYPKDLDRDFSSFIVHFHGNYIPLQGVEYIIKAAKLLENEKIIFNLIGRGQTYQRDREIADSLSVKNINFIERVGYNQLPDFIRGADVSLGIFGDTLKANLVIPNKIFEALAVKKAVITASTDAIKELLVNGESVLLCNGADPESLANAIRKLKDNVVLRDQIASGGYDKFCQFASPPIIGRELLNFINQI